MSRREERGRALVVTLAMVILPTTATLAPPVDRLAEARTALMETRLADAQSFYRALLDSTDTGEAADEEMLRALSGLGTALVLDGHAGEGRAHLERALRLQQTLAPSDDILAAELLHGLARSAFLEKRPDLAHQWLRRELRLLEPHAEQRPEDVARSFRELARTQQVQLDDPSIDREMGLYEQAIDAGRITVPSSLEQVEREASSAGRAFRLHFLRAAALYSEPLWRNDAALAAALRGLAASYAAEGDTDESLLWFERSWSIRLPEGLKRGLEAYRALPDHKAFAVALDAQGRWTFGFFTGEPSWQDAADSALAECRRRLPWYGIEADCSIYAENDEIVWRPVS